MKKARKKLHRSIFWNSWLVAIIESYLIVSLCVAISFKHSLDFSNSGNIVQSMFCIICLIIYLLLPLYTLVKVLINFTEIKSKKFEDTFGSFYADIDINRGKRGLIQPCMLLLRRIYLVYVVMQGTQIFYY